MVSLNKTGGTVETEMVVQLEPKYSRRPCNDNVVAVRRTATTG
ncbi:MAG: hypothetical protein SGJ10_00535 [Bacteroidota bacterium]|nr:hypothetical protein [Bacteroidota bacterium]